MPPQSSNEATGAARRHFASGDCAAAERVLRGHLADPACARALREYLVAEDRMPEALEVARQDPDPVSRALIHHAEERFEQAAELCRGVLNGAPDDAFALLHFARAVHNLGQGKAALDALNRAVSARPDFAEGWYALAHALRASGRLDAACMAYERALDRTPGLRGARLNLGITRLAMENPGAALVCFESLLEQDGHDVEALVNAAVAAHHMGELNIAAERLKRALELNPGHVDAHRHLGGVYNEAGYAEAARKHLERALELAPGDPDLYAELAAVHELSSDLGAVESTLARGLQLAPGHPALNLETARLERRRGEAARALDRLGRFDAAALPPRQAQQYFHESALCLDRLDRADEAMRAIDAAKRVSAHNPRARAIDRDAFYDRLAALARWLQGPASGVVPADDGYGRDLCFLVGFPRSGTTLLDTMLDAHPEVDGIEEKPTLEQVVGRLEQMPGAYPFALDSLGEEEIRELRAIYRGAAAKYLPEPPARLVVDKLPLRLLETGLIRRLFPAARVLFIRRHPCDVVLSNYMQLYEPNEAFIHCDTLAGTVRFYDAVMTLWPRLAPMAGDNLAYLRYEDLVTDPEGELARICGFLGIGWHADMLDTRKRTLSRGRIRTNSYQQVAEGLYRRAAGRWTRYRQHLEPFFGVLAPHAQAMGYARGPESL